LRRRGASAKTKRSTGPTRPRPTCAPKRTGSPGF
jgi:hypothetical protein